MTDHDDLMVDLANKADRAHRAAPRADVPPADLWQRVLSQTRTEEKETNQMSSRTTAAIPTSSIPATDTRSGRGVGHYLNLAATIALVLAVAVAGWFATTQLNSPGEPEPRLAVLPATPHTDASPVPEGATCDVEPLDTDTVMEIVKNPARFMVAGATGEPRDTPLVGSPPNAELWEVDPDLELIGESSTPEEDQFDEASVVANAYLNCLAHGTQGQIWTFYSPVLLQQKILGEFPVFAEESQVRERVEEMSTQPAYYGEMVWEARLATVSPLAEERTGDEADRALNPDIGSVSANPDYQISRLQSSESSFYESVLSVGVSIEDTGGTQITLTNGTGRDVLPLQWGENPTMLYIQVAKLRHSDNWVIIPWPSNAELGWDQY